VVNQSSTDIRHEASAKQRKIGELRSLRSAPVVAALPRSSGGQSSPIVVIASPLQAAGSNPSERNRVIIGDRQRVALIRASVPICDRPLPRWTAFVITVKRSGMTETVSSFVSIPATTMTWSGRSFEEDIAENRAKDLQGIY
jgi:hypothetical protein